MCWSSKAAASSPDGEGGARSTASVGGADVGAGGVGPVPACGGTDGGIGGDIGGCARGDPLSGAGTRASVAWRAIGICPRAALARARVALTVGSICT